MGNNSIWVWRLFEEIAKLKKHVSELENGGIDDLVEHELDVIEEQIDFSEIRNGYRLTPMEFLDFCINRLEGQFTTCVEDAIGYYHLYEKVYGEVEE